MFDIFIRSGCFPQEIPNLLFMHLHPDHMTEYACLVHAARDDGAESLKVFGPAPIRAKIEGFFGCDGVLSHDLHARTQWSPGRTWLDPSTKPRRAWPTSQVQETIPQASRFAGRNGS